MDLINDVRHAKFSFLTSKPTKNIEPKKAVKIPKGISPGSDARAKLSQIIIKIAPSRKVIGSDLAISEPEIIRA